MRNFAASKTAPPDKQFADDVAYYLSLAPRQLPSRYLYDALGSALFEAICLLPWYRITQLELALLRAHAADILARVAPLSTLIELGPGTGDKLVTLLAAAPASSTLTTHLVDVSSAALDAATLALGRIHDEMVVVPHNATYEEGLAQVASGRRRAGRALTLFLGSNIGNFDPPGADAFLRTLRATCEPGDCLLMGADLVKPEPDLLLAYNDPLGVTAAFNRNLLVRANRELGADFDVAGFAHRSDWNPDESRIEMHLVSIRRQRVRVPASQLDITFEAGETIWTESSYKYRPDDIVATLNRAAFGVVDQWTEEGFALTLAQATHSSQGSQPVVRR
jgi:L-histidine N-alpha-methyltransferase